MTFWTETAIAQHLDGRFYQLQQKSLGTFEVVDLNEPDEIEEESAVYTRWSAQELTYLVELKRQGKTHHECAVALGRTDAAVMDKWQNRMTWAERVDVPRKGSLRMDDIARVCCGVWNITREEFNSSRRSVHIVAARQVFYWLARRYTSHSLPQIGIYCGRKDHSTVLHGVNKIDQQIDLYRTKIELCVFDLGVSPPQQEAA